MFRFRSDGAAGRRKAVGCRDFGRSASRSHSIFTSRSYP